MAAPAGTPTARPTGWRRRSSRSHSLGATRRFLIRPAAGGPSRTIMAHGGDLVVMGGRCQKDYQHSVPRQKRLSLNFSTAIPSVWPAPFPLARGLPGHQGEPRSASRQ